MTLLISGIVLVIVGAFFMYQCVLNSKDRETFSYALLFLAGLCLIIWGASCIPLGLLLVL